MIRRLPILAAALVCAAPLAAQDVPRPTLLRVSEDANGGTLALDSAVTARTGDSTFVVNAVYHFPADSTRRFDGAMDQQVLDCGRARTRGHAWTYYAGDAPVPVPPDTAGRGGSWRPVADAELPVFQAICGYLLGSFAASLPVTVEAMDLDAPPRPANLEEAVMAMARAYPPSMRAVGVASGVAMLRMRVTEEGRLDPASLRALWASRPAFGQAALSVARRIRWTPARVDGRPTAAWVLLPLAFFEQPSP